MPTGRHMAPARSSARAAKNTSVRLSVVALVVLAEFGAACVFIGMDVWRGPAGGQQCTGSGAECTAASVDIPSARHTKKAKDTRSPQTVAIGGETSGEQQR